MNIRSKLGDCNEASPEFKDGFRHSQQIRGLLMHFTLDQLFDDLSRFGDPDRSCALFSLLASVNGILFSLITC
jgi:hypothetical protein